MPRTRLVKRNMSILSNSTKEQVDPARFFNRLFVRFAFLDQVGGISVQNVYVLRVNIDY